MRFLFIISTFAVLLGPLSPASRDQQAHEQGDKSQIGLFTPDSIQWKDGPASLATGTKIAILDGNPNKEGLFVMRLKLPDGFRVAPHTHPKTERVTVISGTLHFGMGDKFDTKVSRAMPQGSFGTWPPGMAHFGWTTGETVIQLHGQGPWEIRYVNPADDPRTVKR
jgi:quercetin dioxygenase-like cupin family protein